MSLYEPIFTDGGDTLYVMDQISEKNKEEMEVADAIGISQAQVSRLEKNALRTMRGYLMA